MNVINVGMEPRQTIKGPAVATIGFFDGVHVGHRYIIDKVRAAAARNGMTSVAVTFERHPRQVLQSDYVPRILTTLSEKLRLLQATGIDNVAVLNFSREMAEMTACQFMRNILRDRLGVKVLMIGYDNRFGKRCGETFDDYVRYGAQMGIEVLRCDAMATGDCCVSSSVVRRMLLSGDVEGARRCLDRPYRITGEVVSGFQRGHGMGFPTANIKPGDAAKMIPADGVYAVSVTVEGVDGSMKGMMNIGPCPTFGINERSMEVNIFDFSGDIYGRTVNVDFVKRLRDDRRFESAEALARQLTRDKEAAIEVMRDKTI